MKHLVSVQGAYSLAKMVALVTMFMTVAAVIFAFGGVIMLYAFPDAQDVATYNSDLATAWAQLMYGLSENIILIMAYRYFKKVIAVGTPFTEYGAKQLRTLGIVAVVSTAVALLWTVVTNFICGVSMETNMTDIGLLILGIVLIFMSMIFKYGAYLEKRVDELTAEIQENRKAEM